MTSNKKKFIVPQLKVHGNVEEITQAGSGSEDFDVPFGNISDLASVDPNNISS
ncbi:MAG: hypothetical protein QNJ60_10530 [Xenococcaceae cyanobacterium MO_188.B19]|nr:hypothetical protein [Xenococcaceae cyanobacterium MO_188.B19]